MTPRPTRRERIDIGHKCNINCIHCYHRHEAGKGFYPLEKLKKEADEAKALGNNYIDFTGGEPTIYPDIVPLIEYCGSIGLKCCIITNGMAGEETVAKIIAAGIDDWLISIHGSSPDIQDAIASVDGVRMKQMRFLAQLREAGQTFRFNTCLLSKNQNDLVDIAKFAVEWKPRILNFINFNPHHAWGTDIEGTKAMLVDFDIVEEQLSSAIPILTAAGIAVNVRYFPMCRLPEAFRKHVCNCRQVMFDPYEWSYGANPKTYASYLRVGAGMSADAEWNGLPCLRCGLKSVCGGINKNLYKAAGMKGILKPVSEPDLNVCEGDVYHYRRGNAEALISRIPNTASHARVLFAEEKNWTITPLVIDHYMKKFPDDDLIVFTVHQNNDAVRKIVDRHIGHGIYNPSMVYDVSSLSVECGEGENTGLQYRAKMIAAAQERGLLMEYGSNISIIDIASLDLRMSDNLPLHEACEIADPKLYALYGLKAAPPAPAKVLVVDGDNAGVSASIKSVRIPHKNNFGDLVVFTVVDDAYQWYIPMFVYSMLIAQPKVRMVIGLQSDTGLNEEVRAFLKDVAAVDIFNAPKIGTGPYFTAASRFLLDLPASGLEYVPKTDEATIPEFCLITDIDILFMPSTVSLIDQHMGHLEKDGTRCYENWVSELRNGEPRLPGIHFVTREWWSATREARASEAAILQSKDEIEYWYDEMMLGRIVVDSGLPLPPTKPMLPKLWRKHGVHLGDDRLNTERKFSARRDTFEKMHIRTLLDDKQFMEIADWTADKVPFLKKVFKGWPALFV